jgi:ornithine cyclodeaminase/alanine dehydrogenase-like protein (mu-crystallin family)
MVKMDSKLNIGEEILFLSEKDVKACLDMKKAIELCEEGERLTGYGEATDEKFYLQIQEGLVFKLFAGYLRSKDIVAAKIFTLAKDNLGKGLPSSSSVGLIYDATTLMPLAILDACWLTGIKVGASSAVAAKYLGKKSSSIVGIIGAGVQGRTHLEGLNEIFRLKEVRIADIIKESRERYAKEMSAKFDINVTAVDSVEQAVKGADIIVTVTTADEPLINKDWVESGMTILKLGSYQEIDLDIVTSVDKVVVDKWEFISHRSKEIVELLEAGIITRQNIYAEIPEIVTGKKVGRKNDDEIILCIMLGMGGDYVALFSDIYRRAKELGVGHKLKFLG